VAELSLEKQDVGGRSLGKLVSPERCRCGVARSRVAGAVAGTQRYEPSQRNDEDVLTLSRRRSGHEVKTLGYWRITALFADFGKLSCFVISRSPPGIPADGLEAVFVDFQRADLRFREWMPEYQAWPPHPMVRNAAFPLSQSRVNQSSISSRRPPKRLTYRIRRARSSRTGSNHRLLSGPR